MMKYGRGSLTGFLHNAALLALIALGPVSPGLAGQTGGAAARQAPDWQAQPVRLMMVDRKGCIYCAQFEAEIEPGYARSTEGAAAPLFKVDIDGVWPDGIVLDSRPFITPTFILLRDGVEQSRIEGYPGQEFFYPIVSRMLAEAAPAKEGE